VNLATTIRNGQMLSTALIGNLRSVFAVIIQLFNQMDRRVTNNKDAWTNLDIAHQDWPKQDINNSHAPPKIVQHH
jgi:hypothetical protein